MENRHGRSISGSVRIPLLTIHQPAGELLLDFGSQSDTSQARDENKPSIENLPGIVATYQLHGQTEPGNFVELDGASLPLESDGRFSSKLHLRAGVNLFSLIVRNKQGFIRMSNLNIEVKDQTDQGLVVTSAPIPSLTLQLPPVDTVLKQANLVVPGFTTPGNRVVINGQAVETQNDGSFIAHVKLPSGTSELNVEVIDPTGNKGNITRTLHYAGDELFLMAIADGKYSQLKAEGYLEGTGANEGKSSISQGRIAYYLKGKIAGKYLITSAYDSAKDEQSGLFRDTEFDLNNRLLTNLDPDKYYPVYGDDSEIVYDAQSQGKFYLAIESDQLELLIGNYPLNFSDTELAAYRRTLYGLFLAWQSEAKSANGLPLTQIDAFVADNGQTSIRNELRATGGSLYYLSQRDVIEGSEHVSLLVRDKDTGLLLRRISQRRNADYSIRYDDGRVLFNRPVRSTEQGGSLIEPDLLAGHPVYIQIDYEARLDSFEQKTQGARLTQQIGKHVRLGATQIEDDQISSQYSLSAVDATIQVSNIRVTAEVADSHGNDSTVFTSDDGGFTYHENIVNDTQEGQAYKLAIEYGNNTDDEDNKISASGYVKQLDNGFASNGSLQEQGSNKYGAQINYQVSDNQSLSGRFDHAEQTENSVSQDMLRLQWNYIHNDWDLTSELQQVERTDSNGENTDSSMAAIQLHKEWDEKLDTRVSHQRAISGENDHITRLSADYELLPNLSLIGDLANGSNGSSTEFGLSSQLGDSRIYLSERQIISGSNNESNMTVFGTETALTSNSKVYSEYQWIDSTNETRQANMIGMQQRWDVADSNLQLSLSGEYTNLSGSSDMGDRYSISFGLNYNNDAGLKFRMRNELREQKGSSKLEQFISQSIIEVKLNPDYTALGEYTKSDTKDNFSGSGGFEKSSIGLAYRPVKHDRFNALFRYTSLLDEPTVFQASQDSSIRDMDVFSADWSYQIIPSLEWVGKQAFKTQRQANSGLPEVESKTTLSLQRLNLEFFKNYFLGMEYRVLKQSLANDELSGFLAEIMWHPIKHLRFGGGYNFTDFSDNIFSDNDYSVKGWFLRIQGVY
jgi:hypothetical protein